MLHRSGRSITGASSGIGRKITEVLAANGHFVYAGARKEKDLAELDEFENVEAIRLDVTVQEEIDAARARLATVDARIAQLEQQLEDCSIKSPASCPIVSFTFLK